MRLMKWTRWVGCDMHTSLQLDWRSDFQLRCIKKKWFPELAAVVRFCLFSLRVSDVFLGTFHILVPFNDMNSLTRQLHNAPFSIVQGYPYIHTYIYFLCPLLRRERTRRRVTCRRRYGFFKYQKEKKWKETPRGCWWPKGSFANSSLSYPYTDRSLKYCLLFPGCCYFLLSRAVFFGESRRTDRLCKYILCDQVTMKQLIN